MIYLVALVALYLIARPFYLIARLRKDVEDDLGDYYRGVQAFRWPLYSLIDVLRTNDVLTPDRHERLAEAIVLIEKATNWDRVALADRNAVETIEETLNYLDTLQFEGGNKHEAAKQHFYEIDHGLLDTRRLLHRDIPILNASFIHRLTVLRKIMRIPTYPMRQPIQWYEKRDSKHTSRTSYTAR